MATDSGGLSREEFLIVQEQLIDLRNKNYELQEELKRKKAEAAATAQSPKNEALQFASKLMNRGKDQKELSQRHEAELDSLRMKLATQEGEFRLQQETLIAELNKVVSHSEALEREVARLKSDDGNSPETTVEPLANNDLWEERNSEMMSLKADLESVTARLEEASSAMVEMKSKVASLEQASDDLNGSLVEKDVLLRALEDQLLDYKKRLEAGAESLYQQESIVVSLTTELSLYQTKTAELQLSVDESKLALSQAASEKADYESELASLRSQLESALSGSTESSAIESSLRHEISTLESRLQEQESTREQLQQKQEAMYSQLASKTDEMEELRICLIEKDEQAAVAEHLWQKKLSEAMEKLRTSEASHLQEITKCRADSDSLQQTLNARIFELEEKDSKQLEERILLLETRYQLELSDRNKQLDAEREAMKTQIKRLEDIIAGKDDEKNLALKKQAALMKELQKAVREERKRADSIEKGRGEREGWHVVDNDARSNHTFDGNDSVSSASAFESDNAELIGRLTNMQRMHAENMDRLSLLESENTRLNREMCEKNELIEHWIRTRPMSSQTNTPQKAEGAFRKFLSSTLVGDEPSNDIREMNKKLQRMLEETLSKNILLQRDLQTLLERTEM